MKPLILNVQDFPREFDFHNGQFPPLDALTYWHFLKRAKRVIEVGCGYSTLLALKAGLEITAIDPQPRIMYPEIAYLEKRVEEIDLSVFKSLQENDILFIDSSHIYAEGSDVQYLLEKVLPILNNGVLIHFHDYFGQDGYPSDWANIPEMKGWNENEYVIPLTLKYRVLAFNYEISKLYNEQLKLAYPFVPKNITNNLGAVKGASLWLKSN
jgi:SAM-dependent methyltransferase